MDLWGSDAESHGTPPGGSGGSGGSGDGDDRYSFIPVTLPSGSAFAVANQGEVDFIAASTAGYQEAFDFTSISDLRELDAIIRSEMFIWRWDQWISWRRDYNGVVIDEQRYMQRQKERQTELRGQKAALGIDKVTREKNRGEGSPAKWIQNLLVRARAFGIHRVKQLDLALELLNHIFGMATFWRNASPEERREMHMTADDILTIILDKHLPEYQEIDDFFMRNEQTYWIQDQ